MKKTILTLAAAAMLATGCNKSGDTSAVKAGELPKAEEKAKGTAVAYVEIDSLATQYQFCIDQQKVLEQKSAGFEAQLRKEAQALQNGAAAFQKKLQEGKFTSEQEARNAQAALERQQQTAQQHEAQYSEQLAQATSDYQKELKERLEKFLKEYNKDGRYAMILSNSAATMSVLYAAQGLDITADVIAGLNKEYKPEEKKEEKK
ncbi:MAG: OmpH family outer membrane protein [Alloprevotella sp.]|nr:OmpH family outer membrane protein [Alloprevotella sp.]MBR1652972.1 OmpH family outer membrane protein [Alloprevotella sp.]MBR1653154.1 OmpH family outer membrane protein [Alloprevotella sp.]